MLKENTTQAGRLFGLVAQLFSPKKHNFKTGNVEQGDLTIRAENGKLALTKAAVAGE